MLGALCRRSEEEALWKRFHRFLAVVKVLEADRMGNQFRRYQRLLCTIYRLPGGPMAAQVTLQKQNKEQSSLTC